MMMKLNKNLIYLYFCGCLVIFYILWNRFLRKRFVKDLAYFTSFYMTILVLLNIIIFTVITLTTIYILILKKESKPGFITTYLKNSFIANKAFDFFYPLWENLSKGPEAIYRLFYNAFNISHLLEIPFYKLSCFLKNLPKKYSYVLTTIHITLLTIPKTIPPIVFFIELIFSGKLNLFYNILILYIIVLIYNILLWILGDLADNNIYFATAHIDIEYYTKDDFAARFRNEVPEICGAIDIVARKYDQKLLDWFVDNYNIYVDIKWLIYRLRKEQNKFRYYERLVISIFYLLGWLYIYKQNYL